MKRLSINDIAKASLRTGKRAYLSLAIGIFLSIFLVTSLFMTLEGISLAQKDRLHQKVGYQDMMIFSAVRSPAEIMECGLFEKLGVISIAARVRDTGWFIAHYDETAAGLRNRQFIEGRLPENPGEIAVEQQVLDNLRSDAKVGDSITLTVTPIDGRDEEKTFIISGVMVNQSEDEAGRYHSSYDQITRLPSAIVHPEETFESGRIVRHYLLTMKNGESPVDAMIYWFERGETVVRHTDSGYLVFGYIDGVNGGLVELIEKYLNAQAITLYIIAIALIAACCVGISQALDSVLTRRVDQIGMLRAVGATKRQIRKIFGREAWLLALILSPLSVAAGCAFVWLISLFLPGAMRFGLDMEMLLPILLLSVLFILIAAGLPLRRASRILPMGVIRDTAMLRKVRDVKPKKVFDAPVLIAGRQIRLHWSRQIGAALMVTLMLVVTAVAGGFSMQDMGSYWEERGDFEIHFDYAGHDDFVDIVPYTYLNQADLRQITSLSHVDRIETMRMMYVNLNVTGEVPEYLKQYLVNSSNDHLEELFDEDSEGKKNGVETHKNALTAFHRTGTLAQLRLYILPEESIRQVAGNVTEGDIDLTAINEGREVLANAPDIYRQLIDDRDPNNIQYAYSTEDPWTGNEEIYEFFLSNDAFSAGQTLPLTYAWMEGTMDTVIANEPWTVERYEALNTVEAAPTVGAVLGGYLEGDRLGRVNSPGLITTEQGAQAMGIPLRKMETLYVFLDDEADEEAEKYLTGRIESISQRGSILNFYNNIESARDNRELQSQLILAMIAAAAVFFVSSFSMISGSVKRRIRADERMIGTLRAVGADKRTVVRCYLTQTELTVLLGFVMAAAVCLVIVAMNPSLMTLKQCVLVGLVMLGIAAACFGLCMASVHKAVGDVMKRSVVENIREL